MTLADIQNRVTPPLPVVTERWFVESFEGDETVIAEQQFSAIYWNLRLKAEAKLAEAGQHIFTEEELIETETGQLFQSRLMADALSKAAVQSSKKKGSFDRAFLILANRLNQTGFYKMTSDEYSTLEEWLADQILELEPGSGELSNVKFLLNEFIPMIEEIGNGFTAEDLLKLKEYKAKTYAVVPVLRQAVDMAANTKLRYEQDIHRFDKKIAKLQIKAESAPVKKRMEILEQVKLLEEVKETTMQEAQAAEKENHHHVKELVERTLTVLQDKSIPAWGPNGAADVLRGQGTTFEGRKCYIIRKDPDDPELSKKEVVFSLVVPVSYERAVESMLRKLVEFRGTDGEQIIKEITPLIFPKKG